MSWLIGTTAATFVAWLTYLAGAKTGERRARAAARRRRWTDFDERWANGLERLDP